MRKLVVRSFALVIAVAATAGAQSWCLAPGDSSVSQVLTVTGFMTPGDGRTTDAREQIGISGLDTSDMYLVTDDSLCIRVDSAVMRAGTPKIMYPSVVYKLGTDRYAAFEPGYGAPAVFFIDDHYEVIVMILL